MVVRYELVEDADQAPFPEKNQAVEDIVEGSGEYSDTTRVAQRRVSCSGSMRGGCLGTWPHLSPPWHRRFDRRL